ncbi:hypothetical protein D3C73_1471940 [compost metagenome]
MACISSGASLKSWKRVLPSWGSTTKSSSFHGMTGALGLGSRRGLAGFGVSLRGCSGAVIAAGWASSTVFGSCLGAVVVAVRSD